MSRPLVTLGVPVYDEAPYLRESLENLLAQTYPHIEILIADNGSTDGTSDICADYAAKHARITHVRHPQNIGQNANFNYLPRAAAGEYFCWASGHDLLDPDFVETCVGVLEGDPSAVLAYPKTVYMRADGTRVGAKQRGPFDIRGMTPSRRFREVMWRVDCNVVYGMWRRLPMLDTPIFRAVPAADRVFLSQMAIKGVFLPAPTCKYYRASRGDIPQAEMEKRHRLMRYIHPHRTFTDEELAGNAFYAPTVRAFRNVVDDAPFGWLTRRFLRFSVWLCGVMKSHLFPGADAMSAMAKMILPAPVLRWLLRQMQ